MNRLKEGIYRVCKLLLVVNIWRGFQELVARFCSACVSTRGSSFGRCASVMTDFVEITFSLASPLNHLSLPWFVPKSVFGNSCSYLICVFSWVWSSLFAVEWKLLVKRSYLCKNICYSWVFPDTGHFLDKLLGCWFVELNMWVLMNLRKHLRSVQAVLHKGRSCCSFKGLWMVSGWEESSKHCSLHLWSLHGQVGAHRDGNLHSRGSSENFENCCVSLLTGAA